MIDKNRKKELLLKYKEMKSEMGVYMIKSLKTDFPLKCLYGLCISISLFINIILSL